MFDADRARPRRAAKSPKCATRSSPAGATRSSTPTASVDRPPSPRIVFGDAPKRPPSAQFLEQLAPPAHPPADRGRDPPIAATQAVPAVVLDAPLLLEAGWRRRLRRRSCSSTPRAKRGWPGPTAAAGPTRNSLAARPPRWPIEEKASLRPTCHRQRRLAGRLEAEVDREFWQRHVIDRSRAR